MTALRGKKRKKDKKFSSDQTNWFDEDGDDVVDMGVAPTIAPPMPRTTNSASAWEEGETRLAAGGEKPGDRASESITDDDLLVKDGGGALGDEKIMLEPVWVEGGDTSNEKPLVKTYGLNGVPIVGEDIDTASMDGLEHEAITTTTVPSIDGGGGDGGGFVDVVEPGSGRNGMEVPDDDAMLGEGLKMGRGLDDMLMERSIRFYDPKVSRAFVWRVCLCPVYFS